MYKKILVPLAGSELAKRGLQEAEKLAKFFEAEIVLFQVVPFMPIYGSQELVTPLIVDEKQKEAVEKYLTNPSFSIPQRGSQDTSQPLPFAFRQRSEASPVPAIHRWA